MKKTTLTALKAGAAPLVLSLAFLSTSAFAQAAAVDCVATPDDAACIDDSQMIVVTGSILRRTESETPSPVTTVTTDNLDQRAISTVQEGLQALSANNGPALTNAFTANGAFAAGASALSLRGLSTNSTLVLFDGMRAAYYPLADDGSRNFVDLNTIPDDIIEKVEVLRDGASSAYGADAIAGVVNIITKKQFQGIGARAEGGVSDRGDGAQYRLGATVGFGDLDENGLNAYLSGFYYQNKALYNRDRPYPFNTDDERQICFDGNCGPNNVLNGLDGSGAYSGLDVASTLMVRPASNSALAPVAVAGSRYQILNPTGCTGGLTPYTLSAAEYGAAINANVPRTVCQEDLSNLYGVISPNIQRWGISGRASARVGDTAEAYLEMNFLQSKVDYSYIPATIRGNAPTGILYPRFSTSSGALPNFPGSANLSLPVYVCAARVSCDTATDRRLNPNNPFAGAGQRALLIGRLQDEREYNETRNRAYRAAAGIKGTFGTDDRWSYDVNVTAMHTDLRRTQDGYVNIQHLLDVIADGTYNFVDPSKNSTAVRDYLTPVNVNDSSSDLVHGQFVLGTSLADLPGGPLQIAAGGSIYYEAVDAPSGNPDYNGPTQRYFRLNAFGTTGSRTAKAAFFEAEAPILEQVSVNVSGRYDDYSSGQSYFSPKVGVKFTPIKQLLIRGTYSKGFRIPSFGEANALPTTGFVTNSSGIFTGADAFLAQYGCTVATFSSCPTYIRTGSYGLTTLASPNLEPEKSRSFTAGIVFEPMRNVTIMLDYYNIKKSNSITNQATGPAIAAYYQGQAIPDGITVVADAPDLAFPNAKPRIAFVQSPLVNADTVKSTGIDGSIEAKFNLGFADWTTRLEASHILELSTTFASGAVERYDGTLGNFNLTAGSGTPATRGYWMNSFLFNDTYRLTGTVNYYSGYNLSAEDQGSVRGDCSLSSGFTPCDVGSYITFDLSASVKVNDRFTFYVSAQNLLDTMPEIDHVTYGAHLYNPVQGGTGIYGRYLKAGVRLGL